MKRVWKKRDYRNNPTYIVDLDWLWFGLGLACSWGVMELLRHLIQK